MENMLQTAQGYAFSAYEIALAWLIDPANWVQFALLVAAYLLALLFSTMIIHLE